MVVVMDSKATVSWVNVRFLLSINLARTRLACLQLGRVVASTFCLFLG